MRPSSKAWLGLAAYVVTWDAIAPRGETLSERCDDWVNEHPIVTAAAVGAVALHLLNVFDNYHIQKYDVIHQAATVIRKGK